MKSSSEKSKPKKLKPRFVLGIETSCDETSCAVLRGKDEVLSNVISSSLFKHKPFGGVVPEIASRHALEQIQTVLNESLEQAKIRLKDLDLIAVTYGPGLIGSLFVGLCFAKALGYALKIPLVGVNHLEAHLVASFIGERQPKQFIGLLVSGGHSHLSYHRGERVEMLGATVDDAAGEAFDKVAKLLGLEYPGGPVIEKMAKKGNPRRFKFTMPKQENRFGFSFSGIKTAVLYAVKDFRKEKGLADAEALPPEFVCDMAASFQEAVVDWLCVKTLDAVCDKKVKDVVVGGGVSANGYLKEKLEKKGSEAGCRVWFPQKILALDNAAMIARRGLELYESGKKSKLSLTAVPNLKIKNADKLLQSKK